MAYLRSDYERALELYRRSMEITEALGDRAGVASTTDQMALVFRQQGDWDRALEWHQRALKIRQEIGDRSGAAISTANLALLHEQLGDLDRALALIHQAEAEFAAMGAAQLAQARQVRARIEAQARAK